MTNCILETHKNILYMHKGGENLRSKVEKTQVLLLSALLIWSALAVAMLSISRVSAEQVVMTYELNAIEDAYVDERGLYRDTNYGNASVLVVGSTFEGNQRTYIKFDLSDLPYGSVRSARLILNATKTPLAVFNFGKNRLLSIQLYFDSDHDST